MHRFIRLSAATLLALAGTAFTTVAQGQTQQFCSYKSSSTPQAVCISIAATTFQISQAVGFEAWIETRAANGQFYLAGGSITIREGSRVVDSGESSTTAGTWRSSLDYNDLLTVGTHNLNLRGSNSSLDITLVVQRHRPYLNVSVNPAISRVGQTVTLLTSATLFHPTATLTQTVTKPAGTTTNIWSRTFGPPDSGFYITINQNSTYTFATPGEYWFGVGYAGDVFNDGITIAGAMVPVGPFSTTTQLIQSMPDSMQGSPFTLTATVAGGQAGNPAATGTVEFYDATTLLGTGTLNAQRVATFSGRLGKIGPHSLTARYLGDTNNQASTSAAITHAITFNPAILIPINQILME